MKNKKMHITVTDSDGVVIIDDDFNCIMGALNYGDKKGTHRLIYCGCCNGADRLTTLNAYVENLHRIVNDILDEAPFMKSVLESIVSLSSDSPVLKKACPQAEGEKVEKNV